MNLKIIHNNKALKLTALLATLCPVALHAGEPLPTPPSAASGWHYGTDPMQSGANAERADILLGQVTYMSLFDADYDTLPGSVSLNEFSLLAPILPLSNGRLRLLTYLTYGATMFDTSVPNLLPEDTLHSIRLPIIFLYDYSEEWLFGAMVMPGISGDLENTSDAFTFSAFAGAGYKVSPTLSLLGGVFYADGFGDDFLAPGVGVIWNPSPDWSVNIMPPFASVRWNFQEDYYLSMFARFDSTTWNVGADATGPDRDVNMSSTRVGLRLERRLTERLWGQISAGYNLGREMQIENLNNLTLQQDDIDPSPFVQIGINLRY